MTATVGSAIQVPLHSGHFPGLRRCSAEKMKPHLWQRAGWTMILQPDRFSVLARCLRSSSMAFLSASRSLAISSVKRHRGVEQQLDQALSGHGRYD
jgi:hypothetical protein